METAPSKGHHSQQARLFVGAESSAAPSPRMPPGVSWPRVSSPLSSRAHGDMPTPLGGERGDQHEESVGQLARSIELLTAQVSALAGDVSLMQTQQRGLSQDVAAVRAILTDMHGGGGGGSGGNGGGEGRGEKGAHAPNGSDLLAHGGAEDGKAKTLSAVARAPPEDSQASGARDPRLGEHGTAALTPPLSTATRGKDASIGNGQALFGGDGAGGVSRSDAVSEARGEAPRRGSLEATRASTPGARVAGPQTPSVDVASPRPKPFVITDRTPLREGWTMCSDCYKPINITWEWCPHCHPVVFKGGETSRSDESAAVSSPMTSLASPAPDKPVGNFGGELNQRS